MLAGQFLEPCAGRAELFLFAVLVVKAANDLQSSPASSSRLPGQLGNRRLVRPEPIDNPSHLLVHRQSVVVADDLPAMANRDRRLGPSDALDPHSIGLNHEPGRYLRRRHRFTEQVEVGKLAYPHDLDHSLASRARGARQSQLGLMSFVRLRSCHGKMARMSLPTPTLPTARLRLRPFTSADADALFALHSSAYVLRYWDSPPWSERARADRFIATCERIAEEGSGARLAIDRVSDQAFIGWCSLTRWNPDYRSASMGYCLDEAAWGHGYATEAGRAVLQWAFDTLDLNRVQAETDTRNTASARVLEKLGFMREGTLREDCIVNGDVSDSWVYGLLRRQWRPSPGPSTDQ
jgi:RimJ/RimL family protein N-acetyltransferase